MAVTVPRGPLPDADEGVRAFSEALERFLADHPGATGDVYRHSQYSVRLRLVWAGYRRVPKQERRKRLWPYLEQLPPAILSDIGLTILATPGELAGGVKNAEFDNPQWGAIELPVSEAAPI